MKANLVGVSSCWSRFVRMGALNVRRAGDGSRAGAASAGDREPYEMPDDARDDQLAKMEKELEELRRQNRQQAIDLARKQMNETQMEIGDRTSTVSRTKSREHSAAAMPAAPEETPAAAPPAAEQQL